MFVVVGLLSLIFLDMAKFLAGRFHQSRLLLDPAGLLLLLEGTIGPVGFLETMTLTSSVGEEVILVRSIRLLEAVRWKVSGGTNHS